MTPLLPLNAHVVFILLKSFYLSQSTPKKSTLIFLPKKNPLIENFTGKQILRFNYFTYLKSTLAPRPPPTGEIMDNRPLNHY